MSTLQKNIITLCLSWMPIAEGISQELSTDRPDQTESALTVGQGFIQFETGWINTQMKNENSTTLPTLLARIGLSNVFELRLASLYTYGHLEKLKFRGIGDLEAGVKIQWYNREDLPVKMASMHHLVIPTRAKSISGNEYATIHKLLVAHDLGQDYNLGYNLGYTTGSDASFTYSIALNKAIAENLSIYAEPFGTASPSSGWILNVDAGLTYLLNDDFQLDASYGLGINQTMNYIAAGFSWRFKSKAASTNNP
ncbi:MAG: transporter [Saprospiraceae bacterium]|nr:transporter [Saprospiraceae bacterium]